MGRTLLYCHIKAAVATEEPELRGKKTELRNRDCPPGGTGAQEHA